MLATAQNHDPRAAIQRMKAAGFTLKLRNDKLVVIPASQLSPEQRAFIRANKAALVAALVQPTPAENLANLVFKPRKDTALMPFLLNSLASLSPAPTGTPGNDPLPPSRIAAYPPHPRGHPQHCKGAAKYRPLSPAPTGTPGSGSVPDPSTQPIPRTHGDEPAKHREQSQTKFGRYLTVKGWIAEGDKPVKRIGIGLLKKHHGDSYDSYDSTSGKSPIEPSHGDFPENYRNCRNPRKESEAYSVKCDTCEHWKGVCAKGISVEDPGMARVCGGDLMDVSESLKRIKKAGFTLEAEGGSIAVEPFFKLTPTQRGFIKAHKAEILQALAGRGQAQPAPEQKTDGLAVTVYTPAGVALTVEAKDTHTKTAFWCVQKVEFANFAPNAGNDSHLRWKSGSSDLPHLYAGLKTNPAKFANFANPDEPDLAALAGLATLALANPPEVKAEPIKLTGGDEFIIRRWLAHIEETDPALIENCLNQCRTDPEALAYFLQRAREVPEDERRYCRQCGNLTAANKCRASKVSPITDLPQRCEDYSPGPEDLDRRSGRERWPGLNHKQTKAETWQ